MLSRDFWEILILETRRRFHYTMWFRLNLKTAVDFNAEARCARDEVVGLPERREPEGLQGAARRKVTQRKVK